MQCTNAPKLRLQRYRPRGFPQFELDAIATGRSLNSLQLGELPVRGRDDQFAAAPVLDAVLLTERIEPIASGDTKAGFERAAGVVDAGVDDFAVA